MRCCQPASGMPRYGMGEAASGETPKVHAPSDVVSRNYVHYLLRPQYVLCSYCAACKLRCKGLKVLTIGALATPVISHRSGQRGVTTGSERQTSPRGIYEASVRVSEEALISFCSGLCVWYAVRRQANTSWTVPENSHGQPAGGRGDEMAGGWPCAIYTRPASRCNQNAARSTAVCSGLARAAPFPRRWISMASCQARCQPSSQTVSEPARSDICWFAPPMSFRDTFDVGVGDMFPRLTLPTHAGIAHFLLDPWFLGSLKAAFLSTFLNKNQSRPAPLLSFAA